ncbi:multicopper oxidase domain-containing protein [Planktotalea sp.]|uniref:multicopper oxidase family protein n=1 Tax=Planktotalea sp. TaxID=2029877 RepID=UPI003297D5B8
MTFDKPNTRISRRTLLQTAAASAVASALPYTARPLQAGSSGPVDMKVVMAVVDPNVPNAPKLRTYNGQTPGPTLNVFPGENLEVNLTNTLDPQPPEEFCPPTMNQYHAANSTNFHTHGLHVNPYKASDGRDSDNIFLTLTPKGQEIPHSCHMSELREYQTAYNFELPEEHPSGTFWYHAHKHGSTAQQVGNGLVGPLIVRDKPGVMPSYIENAPEDIFVIQMRDIEVDAPAPGDSGGAPHLVLVDPSGNGGGTKNPEIVLRPGEVRRWRVINAAPRADTFVSLNLSGVDGGEAIEVYQIAFDGITYNKRVEIDTSNDGAPWENPAALAPGNRTDFMIRIPKTSSPGELNLVAKQLPDLMASAMMGDTAVKSTPQPSTEMQLKIRIEGDPIDAEWSDDPTLPGGGPLVEPIDPESIVREREIDFFLEFKKKPTKFMIDGEEFDGTTKQTMKLNTAERWHVTNRNTFTHPFHIHVNPFFVTHLNGVELAEDDPLRRWQDTMAIPTAAEHDVNPPGSFTMLSRFVKFTGAFVIHCHILEHEDEGMMQKVEVVS